MGNFQASLLILLSRIYNFIPNFSLVGVYLFHSRTVLSLFITTFCFDLLFGGFYKSLFFTYLGFFGYYIFGRLKTQKSQLLILPIASLWFFFWSNFGVWWFWYPRTIDGFLLCYELAIPFFRNTFYSDLLFGYGWIALLKIYNHVKSKSNLQRIFGRN